MKKTFGKMIIVMSCAAGLLCGCGQKVGICESCRQKEPLYEYRSQGNSKEVYHLCDDCYKMAKLFGK